MSYAELLAEASRRLRGGGWVLEWGFGVGFGGVGAIPFIDPFSCPGDLVLFFLVIFGHFGP